jgi:heme-degrading monooxygenase HmoA
MYIAVTRYQADPDHSDLERTAAIQQATQGAPGALGAMTFRSTTDPTQMMRITFWESLEARDRLHDTEAGRKLGLGSGPPREFWELVRDDRRPAIQ